MEGERGDQCSSIALITQSTCIKCATPTCCLCIYLGMPIFCMAFFCPLTLTLCVLSLSEKSGYSCAQPHTECSTYMLAVIALHLAVVTPTEDPSIRSVSPVPPQRPVPSFLWPAVPQVLPRHCVRTATETQGGQEEQHDGSLGGDLPPSAGMRCTAHCTTLQLVYMTTVLLGIYLVGVLSQPVL